MDGSSLTSCILSIIIEKLPKISAFCGTCDEYCNFAFQVAVNVLGIQHDPDTWPDPDKFDPFRHVDENGQFIFSNKILIFGMGYRACLGENLARRKIFSVFVKLLQAFHITADSKRLPTLDYGYNNFTHAPLPYKVILSPRQS